MLYAGYYNLKAAEKDVKASASAASSRRTSGDSVNSASSTSRKGSLKESVKHCLDQLKPIEEPITPVGVYAPMVKRNRPLFGKKSSEKATGVKKFEMKPATIGMSYWH